MYVITGATGHTGNVIARKLLAQGQTVRAVGRSADRLKPLADEGAEPFVCELTDTKALVRAFSGARAVYAMVPPSMTSSDYRADQAKAADAIAHAIEQAQVKHSVSLSSVGADKAEGTGPVAGLHYLEQTLNRMPELNVLHLRPGYFMENTLAQIGIIQTMDMTAGPVRADLKMPMIATRDIGAAAADALAALDFNGKQTRELLGQRDLSYTEATTIIGQAIGKPDLNYLQLPDEQVRAAFLQMGMSANVAELILEMSNALNSGHMRALEQRSAENTTPTSFEAFVEEEFVPHFRGKSISA
ncbi:MAG: NAD(P)H-binding protein [Pyrinomonadaceae bacterium]|nr:NAD(P)H-binding protein [Pyrinomonadaceae bacterium]